MAPRSTYKVITNEVKAIRGIRERKGLSVNKAAHLVGTNKSTLTALENGRIDLSEAWVNKILKAYKMNRSDFNELKESKSNSREELYKGILEICRDISFEKLIMVKQILLGFRGGV